jgi:hypothetical protein
VALLEFRIATGNMTPQSCYRLLFGIFLACTLSAQTIDEYQVRAVFLYDFAKFLEWPALTFKTDKDPLRICVLGQNPFGNALVEGVGGKTVVGRPLVVSDISDVNQGAACQILFIGSSERRRLRSIFAELRTMEVLTVGETEGFAAQGRIIDFRLEGGRVRLEINVDAAALAKLRISSKMLRLAQIVNTSAQIVRPPQTGMALMQAVNRAPEMRKP